MDIVRREERCRARGEAAQVLAEQTEGDVAEGVADAAWLAEGGRGARALAALTEHQRVVLELTHYRGHVQPRIAEELGIPLGTVKPRTMAALRNLRSSLAGELGQRPLP